MSPARRQHRQNVLSIVVEVDVATVLGADVGPLFAVVGETVIGGSISARLERFGRPLMKSVVLGAKDFDTVNRDLDIRDLYNQEDAFNLGPTYLGAYRARLNANLGFWDGLDQKTDWPPDTNGAHPLTELLLADFMVVDVSKPYAEDSYFEIERAVLKGAGHETCGGRSPNDDVADAILTLLVNAGNGPGSATVSTNRPYRPPRLPVSRSRPESARRDAALARQVQMSRPVTPRRAAAAATGAVMMPSHPPRQGSSRSAICKRRSTARREALAGRLDASGQAELVELLLLRGHILGCIADYERLKRGPNSSRTIARPTALPSSRAPGRAPHSTASPMRSVTSMTPCGSEPMPDVTPNAPPSSRRSDATTRPSRSSGTPWNVAPISPLWRRWPRSAPNAAMWPRPTSLPRKS